METRFTIAKWDLQVDVQATALAYRLLLDSCSCEYCRNFRAALAEFPSELVRLLESLGVDAANPVHISEFGQNPDRTHLYGVFYDVVGRILAGPDQRPSVQSDSRKPLAVELVPEAQIIVSGDPTAPGHFPYPAVEIQLFVNLPWVID